MDEYTDYFMQLMIDLEQEIRGELELYRELDRENEQIEVEDYEKELEENDNLKM